MPVVPLTDPLDPRLDDFRALHKSNLTRWSGRFIAEGELLVDRLLASGLNVHSILAEPRYAERLATLSPAEVPLYTLSAAALNEIVGFKFHRGVLGCGLRPRGADWRARLETLFGAESGAAYRQRTVAVCVDVLDPENLGSIVRTCSALGVDAVLCNARCADPFSRRVLRVSMGAVFDYPVLSADPLEEALEALEHSHRFELAAAVLAPNAESLLELNRGKRLAILFGNEGHGLASEWVQRCSRRVTIPMRPGHDSLNVAVAAGIILHQVVRQEPAP